MMKVVIILLWAVVLAVSVQAQDNQGQEADLIYINAVAWSHDGSKIAVVGIRQPAVQGYLRVIDVATGQTLYALDPNPGGFTSVAWSPDDRFIAAGGYDQVVWVIDVAMGNHVVSLRGHQATVTDVDWNSDGTRLVSSGNWDELVILWDMTTHQQIQAVNVGQVFSVAFSPNDQKIAVGGSDLRIFPSTLDSGTEQNSYQHFTTLSIGTLAWSHDSSRIAFGTQVFPSVINPNIEVFSQVVVVDGSGAELSRFTTEDQTLYDIGWSFDDTMLTTSSIDGSVRVWEASSGRLLESYNSGMTQYGLDVSFSPYGGRLAYGGTLPGATTTSTAAMQTNPQGVTQLAGGAIQIVVPAPSLERLRGIGQRCNAPQNVMRTLNTPERLPAFVTQIRALTAAQIPPGCAADLIAVAEALQNP
jgi:WD40 repeat protein